MSDDEHGASRASRAFTLITTVLAVVGLVFMVWSVGPRVLWDQITAIGAWFALIFALEIAGTMCDAAALRDFLGENKGGHRIPYWTVLRAQVSGRAINMVTPLGALGEATKVTILLEQAPMSRVIAGVVRTNVVSLLLSLTLVAIGAPVSALVLDLPPSLEKGLYLGGLAAALVAVAVVLLIHRGLARTFAAIAGHLRVLSRKRRESWKSSLEDIDQRLRASRGGSTRAARLRARLRGGFAWVLLSRALGWFNLWIVLYATGNTVSIGFLAVIVSAGVLIAWAASIAPLGLGVTEGANYALFQALGKDPALGVVVVVARRLVTVIYVIVGLVLITTSATVASAKRRGKNKGAKAAAAKAEKA